MRPTLGMAERTPPLLGGLLARDAVVSNAVKRLRESRTGLLLESDDTSLLVVTSGRAAREKNGPAQSIGMYAAMVGAAAFVVWTYSTIDGQWSPVLVGFFVFVAAAMAGFMSFVWSVMFRSALVVRVSPVSVASDMMVGPVRLFRVETPWARVLSVTAEPISAIGRVKYLTERGPAFVGVGADDEQAARIFEVMSRHWHAAAPAEHA